MSATVTVPTFGAVCERMQCSSAGNPRWRISTSAGMFVTSPNSGCAYEVENYFRSARAPRTVQLTLNGRGQIVGISGGGDA